MIDTARPRNVSEELIDVAVCCPLLNPEPRLALGHPPNAAQLPRVFALAASRALHPSRALGPLRRLVSLSTNQTNLRPRAHGGERPQLRWRQRLRSATSPSPTRASTAARHPARRRSSRTSASPSMPANDASSSAPTAQVTPTTCFSTFPFVSLGCLSVLIERGGGGFVFPCGRQDDDTEDTRREAHGGSEHGAGPGKVRLPRHGAHLLGRPLLSRR